MDVAIISLLITSDFVEFAGRQLIGNSKDH